MRRLIACLLLLASPALAAPTGSLLFVDVAPPISASSSGDALSANRSSRMFKQILDATGVNYHAMDIRKMKVQWGATGVAGIGANQYATTFNAVAWQNVAPGGVLIAGAARGDSLFNAGRVAAAGGLAVPNLMLFNDYKLMGG